MVEHPIQELMKTAMDNLVRMVDVSTVVGDPVETADGTVIVPVSRLSTGFAAAGGEYSGDPVLHQDGTAMHPFGGGSGAGVSVQPIGFLVVGPEHVRFLPVDDGALMDRLLDAVPDFLRSISNMVNGRHGYTKPDSDGELGGSPSEMAAPHREQPEPPPL